MLIFCLVPAAAHACKLSLGLYLKQYVLSELPLFYSQPMDSVMHYFDYGLVFYLVYGKPG